MKKKIYIIIFLPLTIIFSMISFILIYIYQADKLDPNLLSYYESDGKTTSEPNIIDKLVRNSKALIGKKGSQYIRYKLEKRYLKTSLTEAEIIERFLYGNTPMSIKGVDAWRLAVFNTKASYAALIKGINSDNPILRRAVALALGHSKFPDAKDLIRLLLNDPDESVVEAAIQALGMFGDKDSIAIVCDILNDNNASENIRIEAALVLGETGSDDSLKTLLQAFNNKESEELNDAIVSGLGAFPFESTEPFFTKVISSSDNSDDLRINAVESLADSTEEAIPFLLGLSQNSDNSDIRESAAWTIGANPNSGEYADDIVVLLKDEPEEDVRRRFYESLSAQENIPTDEIINLAVAESNPAAKIAGANAAAMGIHQDSDNIKNIKRFDREFLPELKNIALGNGSLNLRLRSIFALRAAQTPASKNALKVLSKVNNKRISGAAKRALSAIEFDKKRRR